MSFLYDNSIYAFLIVTIALGGGGAYMTGRAQASSWKNIYWLLPYMVGLTFAVRFIHFALYKGSLTSPYYLAVTFIVLMPFALFGFRLKRVRQMVGQYPFAYVRKGLLSWKEKPASGN